MSSLVVAEKRCYSCRETKPLADFYRDRTNKDGRRGACKACTLAATKAYQARKREQLGEDAWRERMALNVQRSRRNRGMARERLYGKAQWAALAALRDKHRKDYERLLAAELDRLERLTSQEEETQ